MLNFQGRFITLSLRIKGFPLSCYSQLRSNRWTYPWDGPVNFFLIHLLNSLILRLCAFSYICCLYKKFPFLFPNEGKHEHVKIMHVSQFPYNYQMGNPPFPKWNPYKGNSGVCSETPFKPHRTTHPPICHDTMACHHWKLTTLWPARTVHHWPARSAFLARQVYDTSIPRGFWEVVETR